ncbi:BnaC07g18460D [Brassica napus]|uniref:BnaC07g18460D protein n=1 Tax=Brassica napus TaxID=3708 RepID=A0A078HNM3_BRANA|nr:BnaC07g18460D [Brassica napus]
MLRYCKLIRERECVREDVDLALSRRQNGQERTLTHHQRNLIFIMSESRRPDSNNAQARQDMEDEKLCKKILNVLREDGSQRVLLAGRAGIGKTRLAKKVGEYAGIYRDEGGNATNNGYCFLTLCLHLNNKFEEEDELSLYENIASQLYVHSDFEETEVDDRDEDEEEEKKPKELLDELQKNIIKEIAKREVAAEKKELAEKKDEKERYLLLIFDDEGSMTKEDVVMKDLKLERFLIDKILKDHTRLKILITRRKEDEEPTANTDVATTDVKEDGSQSGEGDSASDGENASEDKTTDAATDPKVDKITEEGIEPPATDKTLMPSWTVFGIAWTSLSTLAAFTTVT